MTSFDKICISLLRFIVKIWLYSFYKLRVFNTDNIPEQGPVLLLGNHFSFLDALIVYCSSKRPVRFISDVKFLPLNYSLVRFVVRSIGVITFNPNESKSVVTMLLTAREALRKGEVVCIFPEGAITRDGQVRAFKRGFLSILKRTPDIPIVPFSITGFYGSHWAYTRKKGYKSVPFPYRPCIAYGKIFNLKAARELAQSDEQISQRLLHIVQELCVDINDYNKYPENIFFHTPAREAIRGIRRFGRGHTLLVDSTGKNLDSFQTLTAILVLKRVYHRILRDEKFVGVVLPTSVVGVLSNVALSMDDKIPVNLNYTFTNDVINNCLHRINVTKVITSSQLLKKLPKLKIEADLLVLEELAKVEIRTSDKLVAFFQSLLPTFLLEFILGLRKQKLSDINTIVFTSGSTGMPKGTILSNLNISANCQSFVQSAMPERHLSLYGTLPFFHSFGYTVTVWFPLIQSFKCIYHYNPLDYKAIGEFARKHKPSLFISTPTFMRTYVRKCPKEDFESIFFPVTGAEKTPKELYTSWKEKFGHELNEGYGATEIGPVLSHNIPSCYAPDTITPYHKEGSIGRADPNFVAKVINIQTGDELPPNEPGMLLVKGNSITPGYYQDLENTSKIFRDGWYVTGDIARIDEDNFIFITGREMRISKIGGEMAPHILIEERLVEATKALVQEKNKVNVKDDDDDQGFLMVVTAVPDEKKGEKLVVLSVNLPATPEDICKKVAELSLLPSLWIPSPSNFKTVDQIPVLGTGKLDLKSIKKMALELYGLDREL